jgi:hypothetical protein
MNRVWLESDQHLNWERNEMLVLRARNSLTLRTCRILNTSGPHSAVTGKGTTAKYDYPE